MQIIGTYSPRYCYIRNKKQPWPDPLQMHCASSEYQLANQGPTEEKATLTSRIKTQHDSYGAGSVLGEHTFCIFSYGSQGRDKIQLIGSLSEQDLVCVGWRKGSGRTNWFGTTSSVTSIGYSEMCTEFMSQLLLFRYKEIKTSTLLWKTGQTDITNK